MKPEQIADLIEERRDSEGHYDPREIAEAIADTYSEEERRVRDVRAARSELDRYEKANKPSHDPTLFEPQAIVILGDNDRVIQEFLTPKGAEDRMHLVLRNAEASLAAANKELGYYRGFLDQGWESGGLGKFVEQHS